jgi:hypothetical protein
VALGRTRYLLAVCIVASACVPAEPATISSFSPGTGPVGITVTVYGSGLGDTRSAAIGGASATIVSISGSRIVLRVPDEATNGPVALTSATGTVTSRLRFIVAAGTAASVPAPPRPPVIVTVRGYSYVSVSITQGTFGVYLIKEPLADVTVKTLTASTDDCRRDCLVKPLDEYVRENAAYAAMNGTYLCPPDYADCATKSNSFEYAVYNSAARKWINLPSLVTQNGLVTFAGGSPTFYRRSFLYARDRLSLGPITAGLTMYPLLLKDGDVVDSDAEQSEAQKQRSMKGSIGTDGTNVFLALITNATVSESANVLQTLGVRDALNLDGGGTSAMWFGGAYKVGPGRLLPNAVILTRP